MFYSVIVKPILFLFDAEKVHHAVFTLIKGLHKIPGVSFILRNQFTIKHPALHRNIAGLHFENPVGLAAGFDKDAKLIDELANFGFGFIEIGTLTPKAQPGNDKPRLFRLPKDKALINRMGFNNGGVDVAVQRLSNRKSTIIVGGNIGKNKATPNEQAVNDYIIAFETLFPFVDYFVVNVSSPNTPGLRDLQEKEPLMKLMHQLIQLNKTKAKAKPIFLKIAPDLNDAQLDDVIDIVKQTGTDGLIANNTTISRAGLQTDEKVLQNIGNGGLSGWPLHQRSLEVLHYLRARLDKNFPIISVGGIMNEGQAVERLKAGADLIQIYTGFVYEGPGFVKRINQKIVKT
ncbi:MAG: quinone-dependent dihydroorotate dehydrogenase [Cyclobacteriaceae bacterium]|jgi:dihydroorotate dehydrogenase|nr:quinone-dependent dihydroorotate dehydrogenase [Cytophagales bacterium]MCZ8328289.1 quinone-dependent dihydroorotate dehydrogenase [Cyclobacteriaceae bacterium]